MALPEVQPAGRTDEDLLRAARAASAAERERLVGELFERHQRRVAAWCVRLSGRPQEAADLAQEVFLRVHERLDGFRFESRFSTWLYLVTRSVVINRGVSEQRRRAVSLDDEESVEPVDPARSVEDEIAERQRVGLLRDAVARELEPAEARVLYLHHVRGLTLPAIDRALSLTNKSGAKAYLVSAKRKLRRALVEKSS